MNPTSWALNPGALWPGTFPQNKLKLQNAFSWDFACGRFGGGGSPNFQALHPFKRAPGARLRHPLHLLACALPFQKPQELRTRAPGCVRPLWWRRSAPPPRMQLSASGTNARPALLTPTRAFEPVPARATARWALAARVSTFQTLNPSSTQTTEFAGAPKGKAKQRRHSSRPRAPQTLCTGPGPSPLWAGPLAAGPGGALRRVSVAAAAPSVVWRAKRRRRVVPRHGCRLAYRLSARCTSRGHQ